MLRADLPAVCGLAEACFPVPWRSSDFERELGRAFAVIRVLRPKPGQPIAAFLHYWWVGDEIEIMNVATASAQRRSGYARRLLEDLIASIDGRARAITLEVRRSNTAAIALYERVGFARVGVRVGYYSDDGEDAVVMRRDLSVAAAPGAAAPRRR
jgi:ribosomal-protein-alanine N-acetyltransferase